MNSSDDYSNILGRVKNIVLPEVPGRGLMNNGEIFEFQTASICSQEYLIDYIKKFVAQQESYKYSKARAIPVLPEEVSSQLFLNSSYSLNNIPIGILKSNLEVRKFDFTAELSTFVTANELKYIKPVINELSKLIKAIPNTYSIMIDIDNIFETSKDLFAYYFNKKLDSVFDQLISIVEKISVNSKENFVCIFTGLNKLNTKVDSKKIEKFVSVAGKCEKFNFIIADEAREIKNLRMENWFRPLFNDYNGIWIGNGVMDQSTLKLTTLDREMRERIGNNYAWVLKNGDGKLIKIISDGSVGDDDES